MPRQGTHFLPVVHDRCSIPARDPPLPPAALPRYPRSLGDGRVHLRTGALHAPDRPDFVMVRRYLDR